jgi:ribosomal protein S18 acetylase RimI-like enzyme
LSSFHRLLGKEKMLNLAEGFRILPAAPAVEDYLRLRKMTVLSPFSEAAAKAGLAGTYYGVSVLFENTVIGMGRIVGDGGLFFQIVDIAVDPQFQGRGLGTSIMTSLMAYLQEHAPLTAHVSLLADVPANKLYKKFGFVETGPKTIGMDIRL